ncbi:MAG: YggT family protein [Parahaliea sp.]
MHTANAIFVYLLQTVLALYTIAMLLRFLLQLVRADFYNPISQFIVRITNPLVIPLRRLLPGIGGIDLASLVLTIVLEIAGFYILSALTSLPGPGLPVMLLWGLLGVAGLLLNIYFFALLAVIILSWIAQGSNNPVIYLLYQLTEPVMAPFRRILPPIGGLDLSPILVFMVINVLRIILQSMAISVGLPPSLVVAF